MKVKVSFTVDVDTEVWTLNYGVEGAAEIRADVKTYIENEVVKAHMSELGLLADE